MKERQELTVGRIKRRKEGNYRYGRQAKRHERLKDWNDESNVGGLNCFTIFEHEPISHEYYAQNIVFKKPKDFFSIIMISTLKYS